MPRINYKVGDIVRMPASANSEKLWYVREIRAGIVKLENTKNEKDVVEIPAYWISKA